MAEDLTDRTRRVIDANRYLVLGTADQDGTPWTTPVFFAHDGYRTFYWVSAPDRRHCHNIASRPQVSLAIFDSSVAVGQAEAAYVAASAAELAGEEVQRAVGVLNDKLDDAHQLDVGDVMGDGPFRAYCAVAVEHSVLVRGGDPLYGEGADTRRVVDLGS